MAAKLWSSVVVVAVYNMAAVSLSTSGQRQELYFGLAGQWMREEARRGVDNALDDINSRSQLLGEYELKYLPYTPILDASDLEDDGCSRAAALGELFGHILNSTHRVFALIGLGCPEANEAVAELAQFQNFVLLSCVSSVSELSSGGELPNYFQLLPSEVHLARVFYSIIKEYGWRRVAMIVQNERRYKRMIKSLEMFLSTDREDIEYNEVFIDTEANSKIVDIDLLGLEARILVIAMDSTLARRLMCMAYKSGLRYPRYVFLTYGTYEPRWWEVPGEEFGTSSGCNSHNVAKTLEFSLAATHFPSQPFPVNTSFESEPEQEILRLSDDQRNHSYHFPFSADAELYHQCYDATLTLALALNKTIAAGLQLLNDNFDINVLTDLIEESNFIGLSGPVHFDENGIRNVTELRVLQYRTSHLDGTAFPTSDDINASSKATPAGHELRLVDVATVGQDGASLTFVNGTIWPSLIPQDGLPVPVIATVSTPVTVMFTLLNVFGIAFALTCLAFNIVFREKKLIRLSSPNLNYLMITGTILMYSSGTVFLLPTRSPSTTLAFCFVRMWLLIFGYSCAFGTIVAKLGRVYYIFRNPHATKRKNAIQDWQLVLFVLTLVAAGAFAMFLHITLEGTVAKFNVTEVPSKEKPSAVMGELKVPTQYYIYQCSAKLSIRYSIIALVYGCLAFLHVCALYFAFLTRKVKVKGLNDAKYIAMTAYMTTVVIVIVLATSFALSSFINIYAILNSAGVWISATLILGLMFIPKMVRLYKDPGGDKVFTAHEDAAQVTAVLPPAAALSQAGESDINHLNRKIERLESTIAEYMRMTGVDLSKKWMSTSNGTQERSEPSEQPTSIVHQISKVSFDLGHTNPLSQESSSD